jgi:hypothetical protein
MVTRRELPPPSLPVNGIDEVAEDAEALLQEAIDEIVAEEDLIDGLTAEERAEIKAEAEKTIEKERKDRAKKNYKNLALAEARRAANVNTNEDAVYIHLDLPGHTDGVIINGVKYWHGQTYQVAVSLARTLMEKQQACWRHEDEIGGSNRQFEKERNIRIGAKDLNVPNSYILTRG